MGSQLREREFLDVNSQENEFEKLLQEFYGDGNELNMNPNEIAPKVKGIKPTPGFCVKAKDENSAKVFMNICHTSDIPKPPDITEEQLAEILSSDEPSMYRVPLSLGEPHKEKDKGGKDCTCYDVIINTEYYESINSNDLFRTFLITLSYEGIQDKYGVNIDRESCIVLKNKPYHGIMPDHHIRCKPLIAELGSAPYIQKPVVKNPVPLIEPVKMPIKNETLCPEHVLRKVPANGYPTKIIFEVSLPNVISSETMSLSVGEDRIVFHERKNCYNVDIFLPYLVVQENSDAKFDVCNKILTLMMPVVPQHDSSG